MLMYTYDVEATIALRPGYHPCIATILYKKGRLMMSEREIFLAIAAALIGFSIGCLIGYFILAYRG